MQENTAAQKNPHPHLIFAEARWRINKTGDYPAIGRMVHGAGGDGESITYLGPQEPGRMRLIQQAILNEHLDFSLVPIHLDWNGLQVWEDDC